MLALAIMLITYEAIALHDPTPSTKWAQRADKVFITIELPDAKDVKQTLQPHGHFYFSAKSGLDNIPYKLDLELFDSVTVDVSNNSLNRKQSSRWLEKYMLPCEKSGEQLVAQAVEGGGEAPGFLKKLDTGGADNEFDDEVDVAKTAIKSGNDGKKAESKKDEEHSKPTPSIKLAQRSDKLFITTEMLDGYNLFLRLKPSSFIFAPHSSFNIGPYRLCLTLFDKIIVDGGERIVHRNDLTNKCLVLRKAISQWWPRLLKKEGKPPGFLKVDWDKWIDEDDEEGKIIYPPLQWRNEYDHILLVIFQTYFTSPYQYVKMSRVVTSGDAVYTSAVTFEDLNLSEEILKGLYVEMAFIGSIRKRKVPQAFCVCPTRELAQQNQSVLERMGKFTGITSKCAIPSASRDAIPIAKQPPITDQVVIGTPGTMKSWINSRKLSTRDIQILVFDEADHRLAEDGFKDDSERIMKDIQRSRGGCQVLLFSATFNETVKEFVSKVVKDGNKIYVKKEELPLEKVKQYKVQCPNKDAKIEVITKKILGLGQKIGQIIIFVHTRQSTRTLHTTLRKEGYECTSIQGDLKQEARDWVIREFKEGYTNVLITTDLLARGFDQAQVNLVINYDLPVKFGTDEPDCDVYLHRIGRAGRFGRKGAAFNLLCSDRDRTLTEKIENHFEHPIREIPNCKSGEDFEKALKDAGLI
uniref:RNA helicase n=1 Tax=Ananas comosus var. bracteatus TaxID=296719 RepID=A0A6V7QRH4_ANACO